MGARGRRPLWSPPWVPVTFGHCFLFFLIFYSLFFIALDALPCPAPSPALAPVPALFRIFLLLPGTGGGSYTGNRQFFFSFCCQGQEEEVTQGTDGFQDLDGQTFRSPQCCCASPSPPSPLLFLLPPWEVLRLWIPWQLRWSQVRRFACGRDGWNVHPVGWMTVRAGGRSQGLLHLHPQKYTGAESGVASPKAFIYRWLSGAIY